MTLHIDLLILLRTHRVARDKPLHEVCLHAAPLPPAPAALASGRAYGARRFFHKTNIDTRACQKQYTAGCAAPMCLFFTATGIRERVRNNIRPAALLRCLCFSLLPTHPPAECAKPFEEALTHSAPQDPFLLTRRLETSTYN